MADEGDDRELNVDLLKRVRDKIATTPEAYDQTVYGRPDSSAPCGTACCIAGWACVLGGKLSVTKIRRANPSDDKDFKVIDSISDIAQELLGLDSEEAHVLFASDPGGDWGDCDDEGNDLYSDGWPEPFATQWREGEEAYHAIAVKYLDRIIETGNVLD